MKKRLLFVCAQNQWRSPTAEEVFAVDARFETKSAGVSSSAVHRISEKDLNWADLILCMEDDHKKRIKQLFPHSQLPPIEVLDIPDEYEYMDDELIEILKEKVSGIIEASE